MNWLIEKIINIPKWVMLTFCAANVVAATVLSIISPNVLQAVFFWLVAAFGTWQFFQIRRLP